MLMLTMAKTIEKPQRFHGINEDWKRMCDAPLSMEDILKAVKSIKNNKSPGSDGFTVELYKRFWDDIKEILLHQYKYALNFGKLSIDQRRGVIITVLKGKKDRTKLENWKPITLLNVDYKILAKVLATRLCKHLPDIINPNQTGFVKGRYIAGQWTIPFLWLRGTSVQVYRDLHHLLTYGGGPAG